MHTSKIVVITHKQIYYSPNKKTYACKGGFPVWHNALNAFVSKQYLLAPVATYKEDIKGLTSLSDKIHVIPLMRNTTSLGHCLWQFLRHLLWLENFASTSF